MKQLLFLFLVFVTVNSYAQDYIPTISAGICDCLDSKKAGDEITAAEFNANFDICFRQESGKFKENIYSDFKIIIDSDEEYTAVEQEYANRYAKSIYESFIKKCPETASVVFKDLK